MISVVVVEDHPDLLEDIVFGLNAEGMDARGAQDAAVCDRLCAGAMPEVFVLDIMLPGEDGLTLAQRLRAQGCGKLIMLTSLGSIENRVSGLDVADAYLVKPVDLRELAAVIRSVHRRLEGRPRESILTVWTLRDKSMELVSPNGKILPLTHKELIILSALASIPGKVVPARTLAEAMGERWFTFEKNRLETSITRLRRKICAAMLRPSNPIKSARGAGYALTIDVKRQG